MIVYKVCSIDADGRRVSLYHFGRILEYKEGVDIVPVEGDGPIYAYKWLDTAMAILHATWKYDVEVWQCDAKISGFSHGWYITGCGTKVQPQYLGWRSYAMVMCDSVLLIRRIASKVNGQIIEREEATV